MGILAIFKGLGRATRQQQKATLAEHNLIQCFLPNGGVKIEIAMLRQPNHGAEAGLEAGMMQAEFVGLIRTTDIFNVEDGLAGKAGIKRQEYLGDIPVKVFYMQIGQGGS